MAKTATNLFGPALLTNSAATKYTVPATTLTILRHIHVSNPTGAAVGFTLSIGTDAAGTRLFDSYSIAAGGIFDAWGYWVIGAATVIQAFASSASALVLTLNGDQLTLG